MVNNELNQEITFKTINIIKLKIEMHHSLEGCKNKILFKSDRFNLRT